MKAILAVLVIALMVGGGCLGMEDAFGCYPPCHASLDEDWVPECSAKAPVCTLDYRLGDACLKYVHCEREIGGCKARVDPEYCGCISCYRECAKTTNVTNIIEYCDNLCLGES